jgi:hypothetical protein
VSGAIDLFSGAQSIHGSNLFNVDKSPLEQLSGGIEDVIGKQAAGTGSSVITSFEAILRAVLGFDPLDGPLGIGGELLGTLDNVGTYFGNLETFLGELNPLDPNFDPIAAATTFITTIINPTNLLAGLVPHAGDSAGLSGFIPMENLALDLIASAVGGAQDLVDEILGIFGIPPTTGTVGDVGTIFTNLFGFLGGAGDFSSGSFDPASAIETFVTDMLLPTGLFSSVIDFASLGLAFFGLPGLDEAGFTGAASNLFSFLGAPNLGTGFDPFSAAEDFITNILNPTNLLLGPTSPLDSAQLFNLIPPQLLGLVPVASVGDATTNFLENPGFDAAVALLDQGHQGWFHDNTDGHGNNGCAAVHPDGTWKTLESNAVPVAVNQTIPISIWTKHEGTTSATNTNGIQLNVRSYKTNSGGNLEIVSTTLIQAVATPNGSSSAAGENNFVELAGSFPVPAGVDHVSMQLAVAPTVTGGTVKFDDGVISKTGLLPQNLVNGLPTALAGLTSTAQGIIDNLLHGILGGTGTGGLPTDLFGAISLLPQTAAKVQTTIDSLLQGILGGTSIGGLPTDLTSAIGQLPNLISLLAGGSTGLGGLFNTIETRLGGLGTGGLFNSSFLSNLGSFPFGLPNTSIIGLNGVGNLGGTIQDFIDVGVQSLLGSIGTGYSLFDWQDALNNFPPGNILGGAGVGANLNDTFFNIFDNVTSALKLLGVTGVNLGEFSSAAQDTSFSALSAQLLAGGHEVILGKRTNNPVMSGLERTTVANMNLSELGTGATPLNFSVTNAASAIGIIRMPNIDTKGVLYWRSAGASTGLFLNFGKLNLNGTVTHLFQSGNLAAQLTSGWKWNSYTFPGANMIAHQDSENILVEFVVTGATAMSVAGVPMAWQTDNHPVATTARTGGTRNTGGGTPTLAAFTFSGNTPYIGLGRSDVPADFHPPEAWASTSAGSFTYPIPTWAQVAGTIIDFWAIGGGGGGQTGGYFVTTEGGTPGSWNAGSLVYGTDIPLGTTQLTGNVGDNAAGGIEPFELQPGDNGNPTTINAVAGGFSTKTAAGGLGGGRAGNNWGNATGQGAPNSPSLGGITQFGGAQAAVNTDGNAPGGGGGSGYPAVGRAGAEGKVFFRARQP